MTAKAAPLGGSEAKREIAAVAGLALFAALVMVFVGLRKQSLVDASIDPYAYGRIAHGFVEHGFDKLTRRAASLYPTFLSWFYAAGLGDRAIQLVQCAMHAATCTMVFTLGRHLYNPRTGLLAGLFCAVHPMLIRYVADLHMETWLVFWFVATVWRAVRFDEERTVKNGVLLAVVGMIGTLSKGVVLPVLGAYGLVWLVQAVRDRSPNGAARKALPGLVAIALTSAVMIAPWTYRNYEVSHRFVLLTPGTSDSFIRGYIFTRSEFATLRQPPYTDAENECNALFRQIAADNGTTWEADEVVDEDNNKKWMRAYMKAHPLDTVRKVVVGLFTFWYEMTSLKTSLVPAVLAIGCWIFAALGFKRAREPGEEGKPRRQWMLLLPIVVTNVLVAILIPLGRYSVPIIPFLAILAAFGVDTVLARRRPAR